MWYDMDACKGGLCVRYDEINMEATMNKMCKGVMIAVFMLSGCVSVDLQSAACKAVHTKRSAEYSQNTYTGNWWGKGPQQVLDEQVQPVMDGEIDGRGLCCVTYTQTWWQVLQGVACFGFRTPVYVTWWLEK